MKKLIIALVLGCALNGFAQEAAPRSKRADKEKLTPEQHQQKHLEKLTKELNLDGNQQRQVAQILSEKSTNMQAMKAQKKSKEEMRQEKSNMDAKMKNVLSADQYQKWNALKKRK